MIICMRTKHYEKVRHRQAPIKKKKKKVKDASKGKGLCKSLYRLTAYFFFFFPLSFFVLFDYGVQKKQSGVR